MSEGQEDVKVGRRRLGHCKFRGRGHRRKTVSTISDDPIGPELVHVNSTLQHVCI